MSARTARPSSGLLARALARLLPTAHRADLLAELDEEYARFVRPAHSAVRARSWYLRQLLGSAVWHARPAVVLGNILPGLQIAMQSLVQDTRFALRSFRRTRVVTAMAVVTIALGVGASTLVFSVLDGVVLRPLPYPEPGRLVRVWPSGTVSKAVGERARDEIASLQPLAGYHEEAQTLTGQGEPTELRGLRVSPAFFELIGARLEVGRVFDTADTAPGSAPVVIVSHGFWQRVLGGRTDVVGSALRMGGADTTIVGVMHPEHVPLVRDTEYWAPMIIDRDDFSDYAGVAQVLLLGRMADGVALEAVTQEALATAQRVRDETPNAFSERWVASAAPRRLHEVVVADARIALWTTMAAVTLVLLIGCVNVANLLLARSAGRGREIAIRMSVGGGRLRIVRQLLTESLVLGIGGGALGTLTAALALPLLAASWPSVLPRTEAITLDARVLAFALFVSVGTAVLFGVAPAVRATATSPQARLRDGGNAVSARRGTSNLLVASEMALAVVLVAASGLMLRTLGELVAVEPGFEVENVTALRVRLPADDAAARLAAITGIHERLSALPGVRSAGAATFLPMATGTPSAGYRVEGVEYADDETPPSANFQFVAGDYFAALGIPLQRGRLFEPTDTADTPVVGVVNATLAREAFGDSDPIGRRLNMFGGVDFEVVGVVADSHQRGPSEPPAPEAFFAYRQINWWTSTFFVVRSEQRTVSATDLQAAIWSVAPDTPVTAVRTMREVVEAASSQTRFFARALTAFGLLALLLAAVGVYGVMSHTVRTQLREFAIRMSLGARPADVRREAVRRAVPSLASGALAGAAGALVTGQLLAGLLYGVDARDPATLAGSTLLLLGVGLASAYVPARRAAAVEIKSSLAINSA